MVRELAVTSPDGQSRIVRLDGDSLSLGRSGANELCYPEDAGLSRQHAILEREGAHWTARDLGSTNGTFINGTRLTEKRRLRPGDRIVASRVVMIYEPGKKDEEKAVVFEGGEAADADTTVLAAATTLESLLRSGPADLKATRGAAAHWASPITTLMRAGRELTLRRPLPELFEVILDLAIEASGARRGVLLTVEKGSLAVQASRGDGLRISSAVRDRVLESRTSVLVRDTALDEALRGRHSIVAQSVRTLMAVPLQTDDKVIGLIYVDSPQFFRQFTSDDLNLLTVLANVAGIRIERERLAEVEQAERLMAAELEQAAEIQRQLLPSGAPAVPGLDLAGYTAPCRTVGGDYYDFLALPDGRIGLVIADVAGKGMPAALVMASLQAKVQALAETPGGIAEFVGRLNRGMAATCPRNRFVTLFYGVIDPDSGELAWCNAGHNPPLLVRGKGEIVPLDGGGPVLGVLPGTRYEERRGSMESADVLLLYSDGVAEACNPSGVEFSERLNTLLLERRGEDAAGIVKAVHEAVSAWTEGRPPADDVTVVAARRCQTGPGGAL